ncbi:MAG: murein biosynthesis integral membrane protein MurJ [Anaerolineae bacterium]|nr:murein biosynthesis integral membrane protein MurJ [Anaerolineae bacterium]
MSRAAALSNRQIARAAGVVLIGFLASGVLGLVRTAIVSATFGTSNASDSFGAAQRIPELIFTLVAGGALGSSFIPVFTRYLRNEDEPGAWRLASAVITHSSLAAAVLSLVVVVLASPIVDIVLLPGRPPEVQALTASLMRIMMLTPFIFSISGLMMGILQAHQSFLLPALAVAMNPLGHIFGALVLAFIIPTQVGSPAQVGDANVYGLAWGAVLSAVLHLLIQLPGLRRIPAQHLRPLPEWRIPGVREVLMLMGPRVLGLGVAQLNFIVNVNFASRMIVGSQTALVTAWTLMFFALGVIGQSIGTAVFPSLSMMASEGDMDGFKDRLAGALRGVMFLALPATVVLISLGQPLVSLLFERNQWTAESTAATAWALAFFAIGVPGHAGLEVLSRAFYALSDTRTPVFIGVISLLSNILLSALFIQFIGDPQSLARGPFAGLALANSVTTLLEVLVLWFLLRRRIGNIKDGYVLDGITRTAAASAALLVVIVIVTALANGRLSLGIGGMVAGALGGAAFLGTSLMLKMDEVQSVLGAVLRRFKRSS